MGAGVADHARALEELGAGALAELGDTLHAPRAGEGPHVCAPITWARACPGIRDAPGDTCRGPVAGAWGRCMGDRHYPAR